MENAVLTERQSACRAAHEQVQLLQHLYSRLAADGQVEGIEADRRLNELRDDRQLLAGKLKQLGILRTEPDPEREGLLELAAELKRALGADDQGAVGRRLATEEREFLRLCEQLGAQDEDEQIVESIDRTRAAIGRLGSM